MEHPTAAATNSQLHTFLLTTSIKGVPRLTKARRPLFRALWFVFVLSGSAITLYLVTRLFIQFCTNGVTIMITEERDDSLTFPTITLCNLNPLGNTNMTQDHMATYMEAIRRTRERGHLNKGHLFDPETLFANAVTYLNNATAHQFLVACQWHVWPNGSEICQAENSQMFMYQARLGYCFTINPPVTQGFVSGFSAILYLDDSLQIKVPFYELTINPPITLGASLFVHQRKTLPNLSQGAVLLAGRNSHVKIRVQQRIRQPHPYSNCTRQAVLPQALEYSYTQKSCLDLCSQTYFINKCRCIGDQAIFVPTLVGYIGEPLCGTISTENMTQSLQHFSQEQRCLRDVLVMPRHCDDHCPVACEENRYQLTTDSTVWPHNAFRMAFWREYIINSTYSHRFEVFHEWEHNQNDTPAQKAWKLQQIENDDLLTRNFLQVMLSLNLDPVMQNLFFFNYMSVSMAYAISTCVSKLFNSKSIIAELFVSLTNVAVYP